MGYSLNAIADFTLDACMGIVGDGESSNVFRGRFYERGRENSDGAFTASVYKFLPDNKCILSGSIKISGDGKIIRFPTMTKEEKAQAEKTARVKFKMVYPGFDITGNALNMILGKDTGY